MVKATGSTARDGDTTRQTCTSQALDPGEQRVTGFSPKGVHLLRSFLLLLRRFHDADYDSGLPIGDKATEEGNSSPLNSRHPRPAQSPSFPFHQSTGGRGGIESHLAFCWTPPPRPASQGQPDPWELLPSVGPLRASPGAAGMLMPDEP